MLCSHDYLMAFAYVWGDYVLVQLTFRRTSSSRVGTMGTVDYYDELSYNPSYEYGDDVDYVYYEE